MTQHDIRLIDTDDPKTPAAIIKELRKLTTDASDKYETFVVTHEPIELKEKLNQKKRAAIQQSNTQTNDDEELSSEEYTDKDDDELGL